MASRHVDYGGQLVDIAKNESILPTAKFNECDDGNGWWTFANILWNG